MKPPAPQCVLDWARNRPRATRQHKRSGQNGCQPATGLLAGHRPEWLGPKGSVCEMIDAARLGGTPWSQTEQDRLCSALAAIPADIDGRTWANYGRALHELGWIVDGIDIGFEIWDRWSATSPGKGPEKGEYEGHERLARRWQHFEETSKEYTGPRVTVASIYEHALRVGWKSPSPSITPTEHVEKQSCPELRSEKIKIFRGDELLSTTALPRRWLVESFIPEAEVTMLGGDGGTGKTTLALQLSFAGITGSDWLGLKVNVVNFLYVSAEDPKEDIHFRLEQITKHLKISNDELTRFKLIDLAGKDSTIAFFEKNGQIRPTETFTEIENAAREHNAGCIIFDAVADFFGGNENERREVRAFVGLLRGLAMRLGAAVVFIAHPSVDGIKTGRGYSGSTHWNNAVRSRLYFTDAQNDESGGPPNPDLRVIELAKSNRARRGEKIHMAWEYGRFVVASPGARRNLKNEAEAEELFLQLLSKVTKQGMHVSPYRSNSYAPTVFAKLPASQGIGKAALEGAMLRLLDNGKIRNEAHGPPSKQRHRLVIQSNTSQPAGSKSLGTGGARA